MLICQQSILERAIDNMESDNGYEIDIKYVGRNTHNTF